MNTPSAALGADNGAALLWAAGLEHTGRPVPADATDTLGQWASRLLAMEAQIADLSATVQSLALDKEQSEQSRSLLYQQQMVMHKR